MEHPTLDTSVVLSMSNSDRLRIANDARLGSKSGFRQNRLFTARRIGQSTYVATLEVT